MMDFIMPEEVKFIRPVVRDFVKNEERRKLKKKEIPPRIIRMARELGLFVLRIPEEYGGLDLSMAGRCAISW